MSNFCDILFFTFGSMGVDISKNRSPSSSSQASRDDDPASHENEGFLKSMWHNLTNHPAHRDGSATGGDANGYGHGQEKPSEKNSNIKNDDDDKKQAGSGSG